MTFTLDCRSGSAYYIKLDERAFTKQPAMPSTHINQEIFETLYSHLVICSMLHC